MSSSVVNTYTCCQEFHKAHLHINNLISCVKFSNANLKQELSQSARCNGEDSHEAFIGLTSYNHPQIIQGIFPAQQEEYTVFCVYLISVEIDSLRFRSFDSLVLTNQNHSHNPSEEDDAGRKSNTGCHSRSISRLV